MRILFVITKEFFDLCLNRHQKPHLSRRKFCVLTSFGKASLIRIHPQIPDQWPVGDGPRASGYISFNGSEA